MREEGVGLETYGGFGCRIGRSVRGLVLLGVGLDCLLAFPPLGFEIRENVHGILVVSTWKVAAISSGKAVQRVMVEGAVGGAAVGAKVRRMRIASVILHFLSGLKG